MSQRPTPFFLAGPRIPLAITGGIAEGKTTVLGYLREAGVSVATADEIVADLMREPHVREQWADLQGGLDIADRQALLAAMARDHGLRRRVNAFFHPLVVERLLASGATAIEVPLLFETCIQGLFNRTWVVTCGRDEQLRRLSERLLDDRLAREVIETQLPSEVKCAFADHIIRTNRPPFDVHSQVVSLAHSIRTA